MRTLPSRDDSLPRMMPDARAMGKCATWLNRAVARGWHLLTGKLRTKLLVAFLSVSLCPFLVIAYRDAEVTRSALTASAYQALFAAASQTALRLDTFIAATAKVIGTQAQMPPLGEYLSLPAADQKPAESRIVDILQAFAQKNPAFTSSVAVLDLHGRIVLDTQPANVGLDESATDYFRIALETGLPHASRLAFSASDGKPYLHFSSVVNAPNGRPVGVLRERYSAAIVQQMVAENNRLVGPQSFALVLNEDGLLLADGHLSPGQLSDSLFNATRPLDPGLVSALRTHRLLPGELAQDIGFPGLAEGLEQAGRSAPYFTLQLSQTGRPQHAAAVTHMQTQPWAVVFVQPQDVFLTPVRAQTRHTVLLALGIVGAVAVIAIGMAQLLTGPIGQLMAVARQVAEGNFASKVFMRSRDEIGALANAFNMMTERLTATLAGLRQSEENYRGTYENALEGIWRVSPDGRVLSANPAMARLLGYASPEELVASVSDIGRQLYVHPQERHALLLAHAEGDAVVGRELEFYRKDGQRIWVLTSGRPVHDEAGRLLFIEGFVGDITRRKHAEKERQAHLWFLESMDQVNRAIQGTNDLEQMMSDVLDALLTIFHCDRAWLVYPCDPEALLHGVKMQRTRPEFPGLLSVGLDLPVDPETADVLRTVRATSGPVRFGPGSPHPLPAKLAQRLGIQSRIVMALYPKGDQPYMFGLSQCSYPRVWTQQEERLFQEIGRRLEDALTSLLMFRNLDESERKLEEAQRISHVGHWERDLALDRYTWSDETYHIFGLRPQKRLLNSGELEDLVHPADRHLRVAAWAEALQGGRYDVEYRAVRPNGEVRFVHAQGDMVRDESGRPRRLFGTVQDVTERKRAEQRLVVQHTVTQILAEAATLEDATPHILQAVCECLDWDLGTLWSLDRQAGVLRCVELWQKASVEAPHFAATSRASTFLPGVGLPGRVWASRAPAYLPDVVQDPHFPRAPIAAHEGLHTACGFPVLLGSDVLGVMEFFSHERRPPDPDLLPMMATIGSQIGQFIERTRAEAALRASEASLAEGQQISHTGNWRWHVPTGEVRGSAEHTRIFGFDPATGPRSHLHYRERVHPDDRPALVHVLDTAIRDQSAFQHEYRIVLPDGVVKHVQLAGRPATDAAGALELAGTLMDITERKRAEEAVREAQAELAHVTRVATLGELVASIAHEINQPLGAVVNNASACVRWLAAQNLEEARQSALRVVADGHRAGEIITRIRALAQKAPPHKDWLDLNATIREVLVLARSEVQRHSIVLETHLAAEVPLLRGDRIQLQQVLLNLVINAIEAMSGVSAGPRVLGVSSERVTATEISVAVRDSGPGLEPQHLTRLFDAFYTTKPHGLGLGLAISRRIIEAHGGRLWATTNAPHGTVVQFTMPSGSEEEV